MIRMVSRATLLLAFGLLAASAAMAGVPNAANSTIPPNATGIFITSNDADPTQNFAITVRDAANNPVANSVVVIKFVGSNCADYVELITPQAGLNCAAGTVSRTTNGSGVASFHIAGHAKNNGGSNEPAASPQFCATITADGVPLGSAIASAFDLDVPAAGGVGAGDLSKLFCKVLQVTAAIPCAAVGVGAGYQGKFDLNRDGIIGAGDVSRFISATTAPNSPTGSSLAPACP